jgi:hypothetical protein
MSVDPWGLCEELLILAPSPPDDALIADPLPPGFETMADVIKRQEEEELWPPLGLDYVDSNGNIISQEELIRLRKNEPEGWWNDLYNGLDGLFSDPPTHDYGPPIIGNALGRLPDQNKGTD